MEQLGAGGGAAMKLQVVGYGAAMERSLMLGNVVISKKFLRTRKIMVMHSNERGECCLHTLVDRQRKR